MRYLQSILKLVWIGIPFIFLSACSGNGEDGVEGSGLKGTAATGAPMMNVEVSLRDQMGTHRSTATDAAGKFTFDPLGLTPPYLLKATAQDGTVYYTVATAVGVANINPLTDVAARNWFLAEGRDINAEFSSNAAMTKAPDTATVNGIVQTLTGLFALAYDTFGVHPDFNFQRQVFNADHTGFDRLLDFTTVSIVNNTLTMTLKNPTNSKISASIIIEYDLRESLHRIDTLKPSIPGALSVLLANGANDTSNRVLLWNPSTDNIGVTGYRIYHSTLRDGDYQLIAATPFAYFIHNQPVQGEIHCYAVSAIDGFGNESLRSEAVCSQNQQSSNPPSNPSSTSHQSAFVSQTYRMSNPTPEDANNPNYSLEWILVIKPQTSRLLFPISLPGKVAPAIEFSPDEPGFYRFELHVIDIASSKTVVVNTFEYTVETLPIADAGPDRSGLVEQFIGVETPNVNKPYPVRYVWTLVKAPVNHNSIIESIPPVPYLNFYTTTPGIYEFSLGIEVMPNDVWIPGPVDTFTITISLFVPMPPLIPLNVN